jgi:gentisate 1,2-dioxygenase
MSTLGTMSELPADYIDGLTAHNLVPLWPSLRKALPHDAPLRRTQPVVWHYADVRPRLLEAGKLTDPSASTGLQLSRIQGADQRLLSRRSVPFQDT